MKEIFHNDILRINSYGKRTTCERFINNNWETCSKDEAINTLVNIIHLYRGYRSASLDSFDNLRKVISNLDNIGEPFIPLDSIDHFVHLACSKFEKE